MPYIVSLLPIRVTVTNGAKKRTGSDGLSVAPSLYLPQVLSR
jgi:hypothetical protein